jgi:hypothetical protein
MLMMASVGRVSNVPREVLLERETLLGLADGSIIKAERGAVFPAVARKHLHCTDALNPAVIDSILFGCHGGC